MAIPATIGLAKNDNIVPKVTIAFLLCLFDNLNRWCNYKIKRLYTVNIKV